MDLLGMKRRAVQKLSEEAAQEALFTPDRLVVEGKSRNVFVFAYGRLKSGFPDNSIFPEVSLCDAWTIERFYVWTVKRGSHTFPIACKVGGADQMPRERVRGELYKIPSTHLKNIDKYHENGVRFRRKETKILLPDKHPLVKPTLIPAYIYVGVDSYWEKQIEWELSFYRGNGPTFGVASVSENTVYRSLKRYYDFNKQDCKESVQPKCYLFTSTKALQKDIEIVPPPPKEEKKAPVLNREDKDLVRWNESNFFPFTRPGKPNSAK